MSEFDDLSVGLARASSKPWFSKTSLILGGLVLLVAGFVVGLQVRGTPTATTPTGFNRGAFAGQLPGGGQFGGTTGRNGGNGTENSSRNATTGKIKLVDGTTVYVELTDGSLVTVKVSDTTKVLSSSTVKDLKAGSSVTVTGQADADGIIAAGTITQTK